MSSCAGSAGEAVDTERFVARLASARIGSTYNFYREGRGAKLRRGRLAAYLDEKADTSVLLVGEAPGYRGARISGIPFTSERQLTGSGPAEATATIVHEVMADLELDVLCWNVVPTHPGTATSNRRPTRPEVVDAAPFLAEVTCDRHVIAVGRLAAAVTGAPYVRHPAHGGASAFRAALTGSIRSAAASNQAKKRAGLGGAPCYHCASADA
jgi:uracil-DNA glycosylase